jgi:hypothetical protein
MSRSYTSSPQSASMACSGTALPLSKASLTPKSIIATICYNATSCDQLVSCFIVLYFVVRIRIAKCLRDGCKRFEVTFENVHVFRS